MNLLKSKKLICSSILISAYLLSCSKNTSHSKATNTQPEKNSTRIANTMSTNEFQDKLLNELTFLGELNVNATATDSNFVLKSQGLSFKEKVDNAFKELRNQRIQTENNFELSDNGYRRDELAKESFQYIWNLFAKELFIEIENLKADTSKILSTVTACEPTSNLRVMCYQGVLKFAGLNPMMRYTVQQLNFDPNFEPKFTLWMAGDKFKMDIELYLENQTPDNQDPAQNRRVVVIKMNLDTSKHLLKIELNDHFKEEDYQEKQILNFETRRKQNFEGVLTWEQKTGSSNEYLEQNPSILTSKFAWLWESESNELWTRFIEKNLQKDEALR